MIRKRVIQQVGLHKRDVATSVVLVPNPYNNNLDDLDDTDNAKGCLLIYSKLLSARTLNTQSQSLVEQDDNDIGPIGHRSRVRYYCRFPYCVT